MEGWAGLNERRERRGELNYSVHEEPPKSKRFVAISTTRRFKQEDYTEKAINLTNRFDPIFKTSIKTSYKICS